ncbi:type I-G CRISPR-associated helicase/endonuclease Cas3g [Corynebacterium cystitidis]|uniref:CRISPR-associated endonuclease/helicase Cas3 n=1 Tax=Corynebacterium cystitidis DSM 20524 TaxID=1121357 RepID=A0A1H9UMS8_9CORY|nr:type I-U CRISPR-associated helicase/endonuclease Cas3 [Corynebacterium cystitidis]WJY81025.1 Putative CRISPR-associated nuclease/helicase Cas3 [Corynebacterium cystitidis DSM 20524]SES10313.1 CRISPR-associated endonuclease/helicase Cas3 [Corynebacterium cystitidis DSM 20524]SNV90602.1 putative CRISPR-associated protein [Corynebacterium cystitidis]
MEKLTIDDFDDFFRALNDDNLPFTWQRDVVEHVLNHGRWPDRITAPTGSGKSFVTDAHVFVNAAQSTYGVRVPRRLHAVVNRRGLVDSQAIRADYIKDRLEAAPADSILGAVAANLRLLRSDSADTPLEVGHLRGNLVNRTLPVDDPTACAIVAATPDMWGSRLLFRGYGSSVHARPRETALISMDSVLILDEAHLNRQLLFTARRVADLQSRYPTIGVPTLQVVETTATASSDPGNEAVSIDVNPDQFDPERDAALSARFFSAKQLELVEFQKWNGRPKNSGLTKLVVEQALELHQDASATVGCIVNHVENATQVARQLQNKGFTTVLLVGRMRPHDVTEVRRQHPHLFASKTDSEVDFVVATQTLEVGVDMDFHSLVTELAPASSLAQRVGRTNRNGRWENSQVRVVVPPTEEVIKNEHPPYSGEDLVNGLRWLHSLSESQSINPAAVRELPPPVSSPKRDLFQRVELSDLGLLARTSEKLLVQPDLSLWLRDSLEPETAMGGVVVREFLPSTDSVALELLKALPPLADEVFPASLNILSQIKQQLVLEPRDRFKAELKDTLKRRLFLYRDNEMTLMDINDHLKPGDIVVLDPGLRFTSENVAVIEPTDTPPAQVPHPDVSRLVIAEHADESDVAWLRDFVGLTPEEATQALNEEGYEGEVVLSASTTERGSSEVVSWFFVKPPASELSDEIRQEWSSSQGQVLLSDHADDVAQRARLMAEKLDVIDELVDVVAEVGLHHDDGKADPRFQIRLGNNSGSVVLAKSKRRSQQQVQLSRARSGLPTGWRHEQLSALMCFDQSTGDGKYRDLVTYLVGTSHGHGRSSFNHVASELLATEDSSLYSNAEQLFSVGDWEHMVSNLNHQFGHHNLAFLEAVQRAADAQVSKEGK